MPSNRNRSRRCWLSCPALRREASRPSARDRAPVPCPGRFAPERNGKNGGRGHQGKPRPEMSTGMTSMERLNAGPRQLRPSPRPDKRNNWAERLILFVEKNITVLGKLHSDATSLSRGVSRSWYL